MCRLTAGFSLIAFVFLNQGQAFADDQASTTATITCAGVGSSELNYGRGQLEFPDGYFQTPNLKKITGFVSLTLPSETGTSSFKVTGYHTASEYGEPDHWILLLNGSSGEFRKFLLTRDINYGKHAFGSVELASGEEFVARCEITMHFPPSPNPTRPPHCPSHGC